MQKWYAEEVEWYLTPLNNISAIQWRPKISINCVIVKGAVFQLYSRPEQVFKQYIMYVYIKGDTGIDLY